MTRRHSAGSAAHAARGSASVWLLAFGVLVLLVGIVGAGRGVAVVARHRAESAADLAALAGASRIGRAGDECRSAGRLAAANRAHLRRCVVLLSADGRSGRVTVTVGVGVRLPWVGSREVIASAVAGRLPVPLTARRGDAARGRAT